MANKKETIVYYRESAIQSVVSDVFMFGGWISLLYFNHQVLNGSGWIDFFFLVIWMLVVGGRLSSRRKEFTSYNEMLEYLNKNKETK